MISELTREAVMELLSSLADSGEATPEGPRVFLGNNAIEESPIAGCDLDKLASIVYGLEDDGYIRIAKRYPNPITETDEFVTTEIVVLNKTLV